MDNKLKPCPFCGNTSVDIREPYSQELGLMLKYFIVCLGGCKCECIYEVSHKQEAIEAWNKRADTDMIDRVTEIVNSDDILRIIVKSKIHDSASKDTSLKWGDSIGGQELALLISEYLKAEITKLKKGGWI